MDELDKLYNDENLPHGKRKEQILNSADAILRQIITDNPNLLDAQMIAEIVNIGLGDIVWQGIRDNKINENIKLTDRQKGKLTGDGWTWGRYYYDAYFD